jgi:hypothetical protein
MRVKLIRSAQSLNEMKIQSTGLCLIKNRLIVFVFVLFPFILGWSDFAIKRRGY